MEIYVKIRIYDEKLTRFISSKSGFSIAKKEVSYRAFIPPSKNPQELSLYRISTLTEIEIWEIGRKYVLRKK